MQDPDWDENDLDHLAELMRSYSGQMSQAALSFTLDASLAVKEGLGRLEVIDGRQATRLEHYTTILQNM